MEFDTDRMKAYVEFLEENPTKIVNLCNQLELLTNVASQCMDKKSGLMAAKRLLGNMENIKKAVPQNDDACKRLTLSLKNIIDAQRIFGRGGR